MKISKQIAAMALALALGVAFATPAVAATNSVVQTLCFVQTFVSPVIVEPQSCAEVRRTCI